MVWVYDKNTPLQAVDNDADGGGGGCCCGVGKECELLRESKIVMTKMMRRLRAMVS